MNRFRLLGFVRFRSCRAGVPKSFCSTVNYFSSAAVPSSSSSSSSSSSTRSSSTHSNSPQTVKEQLPRVPDEDSAFVRVSYGFPTDNKWNVVRVKRTAILTQPDRQELSVSKLVQLLIDDGANLRHAAEIRCWNYIDQGFARLPTEGILDGNLFLSPDKSAVELQFIRSQPRAFAGPSFSLDPNVGFILDTLNPIVRVRFQAAGEMISRVFRASLSTFGPRFDASFRCQTVFMFNLPFKQLFNHERIELGRGIDICWGLNFTYVNFKKGSGGLLFVGIPVGLSIGFSFIKGGWLVPMMHPENEPIPQWQLQQQLDKIVVDSQKVPKNDQKTDETQTKLDKSNKTE